MRWPALFGWRVITYWQALGLFLLSKLLFGGVRGGHTAFGRFESASAVAGSRTGPGTDSRISR